jgi:hypothetical protein
MPKMRISIAQTNTRVAFGGYRKGCGGDDVANLMMRRQTGREQWKLDVPTQR